MRSEYYAYWRRELPDMVLPWGIFGENLTTEGLNEDALQIGDRFRIGSAEVMVTQPRLPCFKLGLRFGRDDMVKRFLASGRLGFYFQGGRRRRNCSRRRGASDRESRRTLWRSRRSPASMPATKTISRGCSAWSVSRHSPTTGEISSRKQIQRVGARAASLPPSVRPGQASVPSSCGRSFARAKTSPRFTSCRRTDNHCRRISRASS